MVLNDYDGMVNLFIRKGFMKERSLYNILIVACPFYTKDFYKKENDNNNDAFGLIQ